jgi:GWxTD domain-containing protein
MNGDAHEYAVALAALEQNRCGSRELALSATGGSLVKRIRRLLRRPEPSHSAFAPLLPVGILTITAALALAAWQAEPARHVPTSTPPATRDVAVAPTAGARVKLLAQVQAAPARPPLMSPYAAWLDSDVVYIITHRERDAFRSLHTDEERQQFIEQFWLRRDPTPATPENEAKEEHYRRIAYSNARYATSEAPGWMTDRGRIYITSGPPDHIESHPGVREIWRYSNGREYEFAGESYALVRGVHQLKAIVVDRLPQPVQSQLRDRLAPFVDQPMSEALIQQIEQAASRIDRGLSYLWQDDPVSGHTVLELSYDNPAAPSEPRPSFASTSYRVRLSAARMQSKLIHSVTPQYPRMPLNNESGPVTLEALVGVDGKVRDVYVISGKPSLAGAAERAVRQWIYQPTVLAGQPTEVVTTIEIQFPAPQ